MNNKYNFLRNVFSIQVKRHQNKKEANYYEKKKKCFNSFKTKNIPKIFLFDHKIPNLAIV